MNEQSNALVTREATEEATVAIARPKTDLTSLSLSQTMSVAKILYASGYFNLIRNPDQAFAKILAGQEYGLSPMQALTNIHIVEGKPTLDATIVRARIKSSGKYDVRTVISNEKICTLRFFERGEVLGEATFTIEDAQRAELTTKSVWKKYPKSMLLARATTGGAREYCPDIFGGPIYTSEEIGSYDLPESAPEPISEIRNITPQEEVKIEESARTNPGKAYVAILDRQKAEIAQRWASLEEVEQRSLVEHVSSRRTSVLDELSADEGGRLLRDLTQRGVGNGKATTAAAPEGALNTHGQECPSCGAAPNARHTVTCELGKEAA